jgi:MFS family permease
MTSVIFPPAPAPAPPWRLAWRLALGQIFSWGILYYAFTVVVGPMQADTGWSRNFLNLGLSLGLLAWGLSAYPVGLWIQRRGARGLMATASLLGAGALALMATAGSPPAYLLAWLLLGAAMAGSLYDPAFAVVTAAFGPNYRRGITLITLVGGLASTVFIPLAQFAVDRAGWSHALLFLAAAQALVCAPVHWWGIPAAATPSAPSPDTVAASRPSAWTTFRTDVTDPRFVGMAVWFAAHAAAFTGLVFQLVPMLQSLGVADATIVAAMAVMGPMQVAGRLFLSFRGEHFSSLRVGLVGMSGLLLALLLLLFLPPTFLWLALFTALLGLSNGMLTIVRGTAVAELFGRERYAEINGALAAPAVLTKAAAPLVFASVWSASGAPRAVPLAAALVLAIGTVGLLSVLRHHARQPDGAALPDAVGAK